MAIAPTGKIFKTLEFDGESSANYGVYITGQAVYNAPERAVEMISIPGRNGSFALDQGRFENITVTYPAGIFADSELEFSKAISDFRNFLCSKRGYVRLTDDYNPDEYRMAIYKSGLEVTPASLRSGEFEIVFDCKPQRWLMSGDAPLSVSSGQTILNPTQFDASPLLEVEGYGTISFNDFDIELENEVVGFVKIADASLYWDSYRIIQNDLVNDNDTVTIEGINGKFSVYIKNATWTITSATLTQKTPPSGADPEIPWAYTYSQSISSNRIYFEFSFAEDIELNYGQDYDYTNWFDLTINYTKSDSSTGTITSTTTISISASNSIDFYGVTFDSVLDTTGHGIKTGTISADSTQSLLGTPTYIDCDLGEVYKITDGQMTSLNQYVDLGSELPTIAPGANTFTMDNTVTGLDIKPRWWKV